MTPTPSQEKSPYCTGAGCFRCRPCRAQAARADAQWHETYLRQVKA